MFMFFDNVKRRKKRYICTALAACVNFNYFTFTVNRFGKRL